MYIYHFLILSGIFLFIAFLALVIYVIKMRKASNMFITILKQETEHFDALTSTVLSRTKSQFGEGATKEDAVNNYDSTIAEDVTDISFGTKSIKSEETFLFDDEYQELEKIEDFDGSILDGSYKLLGEIKGGGMSRVFLAKKENTGNDWIVKYIPKDIGELTNEIDILKSLTHINLPTIIDIFENSSGIYMVQSYIPGVSMKQVLDSNSSTIPEHIILDWFEQIAQVLSYLHNSNEAIFHLDLKPSNIMVTHGNKLVLIDFGISKRRFDTSETIGITYKYAAPEQFKKKPSKKGEKIIRTRFGTLPEDVKSWTLDGRTDIYSLGVIMFEAAVGSVPTTENRDKLKERLSEEMCRIIYKCLEVDQINRYLNVGELLNDLSVQRQEVKPMMHRTLWKRNLAKVSAFICGPISAILIVNGILLNVAEASAVLRLTPQMLVVSVNQSSEIQVFREVNFNIPILLELITRNSNRILNTSYISWKTDEKNIAALDGNRVVGLNVGSTLIEGAYRDHDIALNVNVVEPIDGYVDISAMYMLGGTVSRLMGNGTRELVDGSILKSSFVSPTSIDIADDGSIYVVDSGALRRIYEDVSETIAIYPDFITPKMVRTYGSELFFLTDMWMVEEQYVYGIMRLEGDDVSVFHIGDGYYTAIRDMVVVDDIMYLIERNDGTGETYLKSMSLTEPEDIITRAILPEGTSSLSFDDENNRIFLADGELGVIMMYRDGEIVTLAGTNEESGFIDGTAPLFYEPTQIVYYDNSLYVWDFNVLRRLVLEGDSVSSSITVAGVPSPVYSMEFEENYNAEEIIFPYSRLAEFIINEGRVIITDPKRSLIWSIDNVLSEVVKNEER